VYDCFTEDNIIDPVVLGSGTRFVAGIDWGYNDPFVIIVRGITAQGKHFEVAEYCKSLLTITPMLEIAQRLKSVYGIERFYCDPSRPDYIAEFNRHGLTAVGAQNDIRIGIDRHYELIKSRNYMVFRGACKFSVDEYDSYHYPEPIDLKPDQSTSERQELPVDANNHCMDAIRYITISTYKSELRHRPSTPDEMPPKNKLLTSPAKHIKKLITPSNNTISEKWS
jgi:hypothetical protein